MVYVRNLTPTVDEDKLTELFKQYGEIEKCKKIKDYAFVHFKERENAVRAIEELNGQEIDDLKIEVALAKPQTDKKERRRGMSGFGALNQSKQDSRGGGRGGQRGGPRGRGGPGFRGGPGRYDEWGYNQGGYGGGYDQGYGGYDQGYGGGYGDSYYDDYYGGGDQSYDSYYDAGSRGGGRGRGRGAGGRGGPRGGPRGGAARGGPSGGYGGGYGSGGGYGGGSYGGGRGSQRGGQRGGAGGRGGPGGGRGGPSGAGAKRKMDSNQQAPAKRQYGADQSGGWNPQPIAQQPLSQSDSGSKYYGYGGGSSAGGGQEWYQDSYGQQWK